MRNKTNIKFIIVYFLVLQTFFACGNNDDYNFAPSPDPQPMATMKYYISSSTGSDQNEGTSKYAPWKSLDRINRGTFKPGDSILLKTGDTWDGINVINSKFKGTKDAPIVLTSYGIGAKPKLTSKSPEGAVILTINNSDYFNFENIEIGDGPGYGIVLGVTDNRKHGNITIKNVHTCNMPFSGIFCNSEYNENINIISCTSKNAELLFAISGGDNINIENCVASDCKYGGFSIIGVKEGYIDNCKVLNCGTGDYPNGACGIFLGFVDGFNIKNTEIGYQKRQNDNPDGEAIDFEQGNKNITVDNCYMHNNAGCAIMFFDNARGDIGVNEKCTIQNCRFENNSRNVHSPRGFEIHFTRSNNNNNGIIYNNTFLLDSDVKFISTTDLSVSISENKSKGGDILHLAPPFYEKPILLNSGFEKPKVGIDYPISPSGASWTFRGISGITSAGSAFNPPMAPEGNQVLFMQGKADVSQWLSLNKGKYKITFKAAYRSSTGSGQGIDIYIGNNKVGETLTPISDNDYEIYESEIFMSNSCVTVIKLQSSYDGDKTVFIDDISIVEIK